MKTKKLIVLTGNPTLKQTVADTMVSLKAATPASLYDAQIELVARLLDQPLELFKNPKKANKAFPKGADVTATEGALRRFAAINEMRAIPSTLAGKKLNSPKEALSYFFNDVATKRWGANWAVRIFFNDFAYIKDGYFVMTDADGDLESFKTVNLNKSLIVVRLEAVKKDGTPIDPETKDRVDLSMRSELDKLDANQFTVSLLQQIKNQVKSTRLTGTN